MPLLTVGIPVYNEERYLRETLDSLLGQTFSDWQAIISDNCSTDNSASIAQAYAQADSRIKLVVQKRNLGGPENFRYTLSHADTKYFVWLGGHDVFLSKYFQQALNVLETRPDIIMVYPSSKLIDQCGREIGNADSDIDTLQCASLKERLYKIAKNLSYCTSLHGIFRTDIAKKLPFEHVIGFDHLMLFAAASYGNIQGLSIIGIKRRQPRTETDSQVRERWKKDKIFTEIQGVNPYSLLVLKHASYIYYHENISFLTKIKIICGTINIFSRRFCGYKSLTKSMLILLVHEIFQNKF